MKLSIRSQRRGKFTAISFGSLLSFAAFGVAISPPASAQLAAPDGGALDASAPAPNTQPVPITVLTTSPGTAKGLIFVTPTSAGPSAVEGPEIVDEQARPVWFKPLPSGTTAYDFRVQEYRGEPVITWVESQGAFSTGPTTDYIADRHYRVIATVTAGDGLVADIHEFHLTPEGTALISAYSTVSRDLSSVGGPANGLVTEGVVQEIDIASGHVIFEWHSLDHIGLDESHSPVSASPTVAWDYFHLNAVSIDEDGNLLVGARNTWAAYRIDRHSGAVIWRLGGTKSDFALGPDVAFAWQHNPTAADDHGLIRIFDNEASPTVLPYSRVIWVRHDDVRKTATLERWFKHPDNLSAGSQGNAEALDNGDTFVDWGALPRFSEFDRDNNLVFDAVFPAGYNSYRAYRYRWVGTPDTVPTATGETTDSGDTVVHATWNGATEVVRWEVLDVSAGRETRVADGAWDGYETAVQVGEPLGSFVVVARDRAGFEVGRSAVTSVTP
jgi:Arylsulfotransferase (ASST)